MPQKAWSAKDERQYEHIKDSASKQGRSSKRAKEIAAATVNKQRSKEGRTKEPSASSSASPGKSSSRGKSSSASGKSSSPRRSSSKRSSPRKSSTRS